MSTATAPPILDFSPFYGADSEAKAKLVDEVRECCHYNGFFQITGHKVPLELQRRVMDCSKRFFSLPLEEKMQIDKSTTYPHRAQSDMLIVNRYEHFQPRLRTPSIANAGSWHRA